MLCGVADQGVDGLDLLRKIFVVGDGAPAILAAGGFAVMVVDVNQVDVAGDIEFARAQLAHANHPQLGTRARLTCRWRRLRRAIQCVQRRTRFTDGDIKRQFGQLGHGACHHRQRNACGSQRDERVGLMVKRGGFVITVQHHQAFENELAQDAQAHPGVGFQWPQGLVSGLHGGADRLAGRQQRELAGITPAYALDKTGVVRCVREGGQYSSHGTVTKLPGGALNGRRR